MQIGAKRAAIRKVPFAKISTKTFFCLRFSSFLPSVIRSPLGPQLDHELGIPLGSITADDFQLITRIHYIAGTACCRPAARPSAAARYIHPLFNTGKRFTLRLRQR